MDELVRSSWAWLLAIGLLGGILSGTLGVGSGILIVPALALGLAVPQKAAQGVCLAVMVPMALMGAIRYQMNPDIRMSIGAILIMAPVAVIGAYMGSHLAAVLPPTTLRKVFGVFIVLVGVKMIVSRSQPTPTRSEPELVPHVHSE